MRKLFYATFEKGFQEIVEKFIKSQDKAARVKRIYTDSVIFFAEEKFNFSNNLFLESFVVYDNIKKEGVGSINAEMKHLLEKKNFKLQLPSGVKKFKLTFVKNNEKILIDSNLRNAVEVMLQRSSKKQIGFFGTDVELIILAKEDGECLFMRKLEIENSFSNLLGAEISSQCAFALNFLSSPVEKEVSLDPFAGVGAISFVRSKCFKKANVIANEKDKNLLLQLKKNAKLLKDKAFSVLNYDFLSEAFPIHFIDKIVTIPPTEKETLKKFIEKAHILKVKKIVLLCKNRDCLLFTKNKFNLDEEFSISKEKIFVFSLKK